MATDVDAEREAQRARPAPTANELRVLAKRLRAIAKAVFQSGKLDSPFVKGECAAIPHPLVTGWYTRANAWNDKDQKRLFGTICSLLAKMYSGQAAESPTERLESLATDVDALAVTLEWPTESDQQKIAAGIQKLVTALEQYAPLKGEPAKFVNDDRSRAAATAHGRISDANFQLRHLVNPDDDDPDRFRDIEQSPVLLEDQCDALHTVAQITQELLSLYGTGQTAKFRPFFYWYPGRCPDVPREWVDALSAAKTRLGSREVSVKGTTKLPTREQRPLKKVRRLNVQKVQGSGRRFRVCREPVTVSPKGARILDAIVSLQEDGETINPKTVMLKADYKLTKDERRTFECDKGRLNKVLIAAVEKGLYVKDDGEFRLQSPPAARNRKTARRR